MSNTPPIQRYFLEERHLAELNKENPLGNQGEIAKAFADLLKAMWSGQHHSFPPRAFKVNECGQPTVYHETNDSGKLN